MQRENKPAQRVFNAIILLVFILILFRICYKNSSLQKVNLYTIGIITNTGDDHVVFSFNFKGKEISGESQLPSRNGGRFRNIEKGRRYLIKFSKEELWISELQVNYLVPDCVKEAPSEGWEGIPDFTKMCE
jgi:hypothetical protein